jgi:hypothetical protein
MKRVKLIEEIVPDCFNCPFRGSAETKIPGHFEGMFKCIHNGRIDKMPKHGKFPEWCPLPDKMV